MDKPLTKRKALLLGASGLVGGHCLQALLKDEVYDKVLVAVRKKLPIIHEKLEQVTVDFDQLERFPFLFEVDDVFCCLGTTMKQAGSRAQFRKVDEEYPLTVAKLALDSGARQYLLVSSMGADKNSVIFYSKVKGETEVALQQMPYGAIHIFRPSMLLGERKEQRVGEKIGIALEKVLSFAMIGPLKKYRSIEADTVAQAMVIVAKSGIDGNKLYESDKIQSIFDKQGFA